MQKRLFITCLLSILFPVAANAWMLTVKVAGGSASNYATVSFGTTTQQITGGTVYYYPSAAANVAITAVGGTSATVLVDGVATTAPSVNWSTAPYANHTLSVAFAAPTPNSVSIAQTAGGTISLQLPNGAYSSTGASGVAIGTTLPVTIAAAGSYRIVNYVINGVSSTAGLTGAAGQVLSLPGYTVTSTPAPNTITANFAIVANVSASLSAPGSGYTTQPVTCSATATSNDTGIQYAFTVAAVPAGSTVSTASGTFGIGNIFTFTPDVAGTYTIRLDVKTDNGGAYTTFATVAVSNYLDYLKSQCISCHSTSTPVPVNAFLGSPHNGVRTCQDCHTDPHVTLPSQNICASCHTDSSGNVPAHPFAIGSYTCVFCHDPHSTVATTPTMPTSVHYNNMTGAMYPASYVTSRSDCTNCHYDNPVNLANRQQWAASGHAAITDAPWVAYDFKTKPGCVQCHTTTGFIAYSTGRVTAAWGAASDKTKEVLTCIACHKDITNGTIRTVAPVRPYADDSFRNPDVGESNVCLACHSGRKNGASISAQLAANPTFANQPFIDSHYLAAGGSVYGKGGYHFPGRSYASYSTNTHHALGIADNHGTGTGGPCVACHKNSANGHTFQAGAVAVCAGCHGAALTTAQLTAEKSDFATGLAILKAELAAKGHPYSSTYPYFNETSWGSGQAGANTMGAAFNYLFLLSEPGAYAHNQVYAKQLLLDSIDYLDDGVINGSIDTVAIPNLIASGAISQQAADSFAGYRGKNACTVCHGGPASSTGPIASGSHPTHISADYGPAGYLGNDSGACAACHVTGGGTHLNGVVDLATGTGSACRNCHAGTVPVWGSGRIACTVCHSATPAVLANGVAAPYKASFGTTGHGRFAISNDCTVCHDPNSRHISGSLGSTTRLRLSDDNNQCASCHNDATKVRPAFRNMSTHVTTDGQPLLCVECHDPHGTTNLHMIRSRINGVQITFTDEVSGFVDPVTNLGFCQVCHTKTNHYRAGIPETNHATSGCLTCHSHNSSGGAFRPVGRACDSCHGYPPAPAGFVGTMGNWSSARADDYAGGAGAHLVAAHIKKTARASEGWANCTICHGNGSFNPATHTMSMPVTPSKVSIDVDDKYKFNPGVPLGPAQYNGVLKDGGANATGSCANVSCHFKPSKKWSTVQ